jgi:hypothetical protein
MGFNGTILAYGQTSSGLSINPFRILTAAGKTHTMEGPSLWDTSTQGVIPRAIDKLFQAIGEADVLTAFTVSVSYYEVLHLLLPSPHMKPRCIVRKFAICSIQIQII